MPSFDTVSEVDMHEVTNSIDQAKRELGNRWDFKNVDADIVFENNQITFSAQQDFQVDQLIEMLQMAFSKRGVDVRALGEAVDSKAGKLVKRTFGLKQGIEQPVQKKMIKMVKDAKLKVQTSIQGEKLRVTGKKRDDLQEVMALFRASEEINIPLQFNNFRD